MTKIITRNEQETKKFAGLFARKFIKKISRGKKAPVIGLIGELGSGKTCFVQGFAKGLGIKNKITSPTFVLMKSYKLQVTSYLYHLDCYRLNKPKDVLDLDFKEIISNPKNIVLIEWAEKIRIILPKGTIWIRLEVISENTRKIKIL